jgi:hypothetical protein
MDVRVTNEGEFVAAHAKTGCTGELWADWRNVDVEAGTADMWGTCALCDMEELVKVGVVLRSLGDSAR